MMKRAVAVSVVVVLMVVTVESSLLEMAEQLHCCMPDCPLLKLAEFADYGCWCGFGGSGKPVDGMDACCKVHDDCYTAATGCEYYIVNYKWKCTNHTLQCEDKQTDCALRVCECDKHLGECLAANGGCPDKGHINFCPGRSVPSKQ